jgi:hypothetical protein
MKQLSIELTVDETNLVLTALSKLPYEVSYVLIDKVKSSAQSQLIASKVEEAVQVEG